MVLSYTAYNETLEKQKQKDSDIEELKRSLAFLADKFNNFLLSQPQNKLLYDQEYRNIKGIIVEPELNNKITGKVIPRREK